MRTAPRPWPAEGVIALGIVSLALLQLVAWNLAPRPDRLLIGGALALVAVAAWTAYALVRHGRRDRDPTRRAAVPPDADPDTDPDTGEQWFTDDTLDGFPAQAVRPLLEGPDPPDPNRLYTAWVFARHGYDTVWIAHHLDLPTAAVKPLVDAVSAGRRRAQRSS
ncbi:hypothetical protein NGB36_31105 [Streptomyces sp. RB6PN25]|uniref:Uncharacterized protein n=1 Tax=Streptomyces humicola TaxID=2953240 RepID=A0ABT1Q4N6_9ACTN|nr:hypothetical protein [Streptomyces humicola]MCQ4084897.1 hypothetical protein [Streptomyces humicola]